MTRLALARFGGPGFFSHANSFICPAMPPKTQPMPPRLLLNFMAGRYQFSLQALLAWVSLLAIGLGLVRWLATGQMPSGQFMFAAVVGAIYGGAVLLLARN